ncbi:tetratricopeptide repeat protein [Candidatus Uabimicrobium sp. HlEnr_7]|uniref:tetratricopeptide repeat protein n=1 Tax=Candidatus Uabimicrobium helgolandensis TaxID=3095367 RepID=UPI00355659F4
MINFDSLWNYQDPETTRKKFISILDSSPQNNNYTLQLKTQISRTYSLQQNFTKAHNILDDIAQIKERDSLTNIRYLLERGRTFNSANDHQKATNLFLQALEIANKEQYDFYIIDALHMLGISDTNSSMEWNLKALSVAEKTEEEKARNWCGSLYNNIGWGYFEMKEYEKAHHLFLKTQAWHEDKGDLQRTLIARWSIAKTLRMQNKMMEALAIQKKLESVYDDQQKKDGYVYEELAECYLSLEDSNYKRYAQKAYDELNKDMWLQKNENSRLQRLKKLAE